MPEFCCNDFKEFHWDYQVTGIGINELNKTTFTIPYAKKLDGTVLSKFIYFCPFCGANLRKETIDKLVKK